MNENKEATKYFDRLLSSIGVGKGSSFSTITKDEIYETLLQDMIEASLPMISFKGLPHEIPLRSFNLYRQINGFTIFTKYKDKYYAFIGGLGGTPDPYYEPTIATIANPALNYNASLKIGTECVLIRHDPLMTGLLPWHRLYAYQMAEALCTLRIGLINSRAEYIITAMDDNEKDGATQFLATLEEGNKLGHIVAGSYLGKGEVNTLPYTQNAINTIRSATETLQYLYSKWASGIGLQATYNTKREYVSDKQSTIGDQAIKPKIDQILESAQEACNEINSLYGLKVTASLGDVWISPEPKEEKSADTSKDKLKEDKPDEANH